MGTYDILFFVNSGAGLVTFRGFLVIVTGLDGDRDGRRSLWVLHLFILRVYRGSLSESQKANQSNTAIAATTPIMTLIAIPAGCHADMFEV